jgi:RNA polymerase sigma-70 factor (ECF subfamily)
MDRERQHPDGDLLLRMQAGDEEAFVILYRRLQGPVYRFALHMSGNKSVAEDVVQEAFMTLIQQSGRFDPERGQLSAFLFGIARNHLLRRFAADQRMMPFPEIGPNGDSIARNGGGVTGFVAPLDLVRGETIAQVREAVLSLPERYREVVVLCDLQEISYAAAASILQCAVGTVRSRLHRGRALLALKLRDLCEVEERRAVASGGRQ